jgi:hypothetical protein
MTLHRVTVAAFAFLLVLSGIGTLTAARDDAPAPVESVQLTDAPEETPLSVGGEAEPVEPLDENPVSLAGPPVESEDPEPADVADEAVPVEPAPVVEAFVAETADDHGESDDEAGEGDESDD